MHEGKSFDYLKCHKCGASRGHPEKFRDLQLGVRGMTSLQQSFEAYTAGEELDGIDCPSCGTRSSHTKGIAFRKLPEIMTLQLRRFDMNYETMQRVKVNDAIDIPDVIDMAPFITPEEDADKGTKEGIKAALNALGAEGEGEGTSSSEGGGGGAVGEQKYELLSICMHIGSALSGHYFAYIKEAGTGRWLNFNDANVTELEQSQLAGILSTLPPEEEGTAGDAPQGAVAVGESGRRVAAMLVASAPAASAGADAEAKWLEELPEDSGDLLGVFASECGIVRLVGMLLPAGAAEGEHAVVARDVTPGGAARLPAALVARVAVTHAEADHEAEST